MRTPHTVLTASIAILGGLAATVLLSIETRSPVASPPAPSHLEAATVTTSSPLAPHSTRTRIQPPPQGPSSVLCFPNQTSDEVLRALISTADLHEVKSLAARFANRESLHADLELLRSKPGNGAFAANLALAMRAIGECEASNYLLDNASGVCAVGNGYVLNLGALYEAALPQPRERDELEMELLEIHGLCSFGY